MGIANADLHSLSAGRYSASCYRFRERRFSLVGIAALFMRLMRRPMDVKEARSGVCHNAGERASVRLRRVSNCIDDRRCGSVIVAAKRRDASLIMAETYLWLFANLLIEFPERIT